MRLASARDFKQTLIHGLRALPTHWTDTALTRDAFADTSPDIAIGLAPLGHDEFAVVVHLQRKAPESLELLEHFAMKYPREVQTRFVGRVKPHGGGSPRSRPVDIGCSVGHASGSAGTAGPFVKLANGWLALASNNHVLALENTAAVGDPILQPGPADGGSSADRIAHLAMFVPLTTTGANYVDAAVALPDPDTPFEPSMVPGIGRLMGTHAGVIDENLIVTKRGRTTGVTRGFVSAFEVDAVEVDYQMGVLIFDQQLAVDSFDASDFSLHGDSGSLVVTEESREALGLLFAGSEYGPTYVNPIHDVLANLSADLAY